jgi:hypothetical protein
MSTENFADFPPFYLPALHVLSPSFERGINFSKKKKLGNLEICVYQERENFVRHFYQKFSTVRVIIDDSGRDRLLT